MILKFATGDEEENILYFEPELKTELPPAMRRGLHFSPPPQDARQEGSRAKDQKEDDQLTLRKSDAKFEEMQQGSFSLSQCNSWTQLDWPIQTKQKQKTKEKHSEDTQQNVTYVTEGWLDSIRIPTLNKYIRHETLGDYFTIALAKWTEEELWLEECEEWVLQNPKS